MYRISVVLLFIALSVLSFAQTRNKSIPAFDIVQSDGKHLKATDLQQGKPVMIVYFDPDCDHCVLFINDLKKQAAKFENCEVVLVTYVPLKRLKTYVSESGLAKYPGFKAGTEGTKFTVRFHYDVIQFPYLALHDSSGKLFATFESDVPSATALADMLRGK